MLDWALSKIIVSVFTVMLIIFSVFVFSAKRPDIEENELKAISDQISSNVNELSNTNSNSSVSFTFSENVTAVTLPADIDDERYDMLFSTMWVTLETDRKSASSDFTERVHLWNPDEIDYMTNETEMEELDRENTRLELVSGENFRVVRSELIVSGEIQYRTFLFQV